MVKGNEMRRFIDALVKLIIYATVISVVAGAFYFLLLPFIYSIFNLR